MTEANDLESRKNELFATITLLASCKRDLVSARGSRRMALIERQAQLEADKERLSHEVNSQYMYRNLQAFMNRVDEYDGARQKEAKETHTGLAGLSGQFRELAEDVTQLKQADQAQGEQIDALSKDMATIKKIIEARPAQRKAEAVRFEERQAAIEARLSELEAEREKYTPEEREQMIGSLMELLAWWNAGRPDTAAHGDGNQ
jgi:chromosome segregation ATPase